MGGGLDRQLSVTEVEGKRKKRKSGEDVQSVSPIPEKCAKDDHIREIQVRNKWNPVEEMSEERKVRSEVHTPISDKVSSGDQTTGGIRKCDKISCDWAYWYIPDTNEIQPARVTIKSRKRIVGKLESISKKAMPEKSVKKCDKDDKPWRNHMKPIGSVKNEVSVEEKEEKGEPEKPWRTHMKKASPEKPKLEEKKPEKTEPERPWRVNMKHTDSNQPVKENNPEKRRHYDRKQVREYMKNKRIKDREIQKEKEHQSQQRQDIIKRRLEELDK